MPYLKGALLVYEIAKFVPIIKSVVVFQFNPESISRSITIPQTNTDNEVGQAGKHPIEEITFTAHFDAADKLNQGDDLAKLVGVGPQLAALEKLVYPISKSSSLLGAAIGAAVDAVGSLFGKKGNPTQPIPREQYPQVLFFWGPARILPVIFKSMTIKEQMFDQYLNPVKAEVDITLSVLPDSCSLDVVAKGALKITQIAEDTMALSNFVNTFEEVKGVVSSF